MNEKLYIVVYQKEIDGEIFIEHHTGEWIREFSKSNHYLDYAILEDTAILKHFDSEIELTEL